MKDRTIDSTLMLLMLVFGFMIGISTAKKPPEEVRYLSPYSGPGIFHQIVQEQGVDYACS